MPVINTNLVRSEATSAAVSKDTYSICNFSVSKIIVFGLYFYCTRTMRGKKRRLMGSFVLRGPNPVLCLKPLPDAALIISRLWVRRRVAVFKNWFKPVKCLY